MPGPTRLLIFSLHEGIPCLLPLYGIYWFLWRRRLNSVRKDLPAPTIVSILVLMEIPIGSSPKGQRGHSVLIQCVLLWSWEGGGWGCPPPAPPPPVRRHGRRYIFPSCGVLMSDDPKCTNVTHYIMCIIILLNDMLGTLSNQGLSGIISWICHEEKGSFRLEGSEQFLTAWTGVSMADGSNTWYRGRV